MVNIFTRPLRGRARLRLLRRATRREFAAIPKWYRIFAGLGWAAVICFLGWVLNLSGKQSPPAVVVLLNICAIILLSMGIFYPGKSRWARRRKRVFNIIVFIVVGLLYVGGLKFFNSSQGKTTNARNAPSVSNPSLQEASPPPRPNTAPAAVAPRESTPKGSVQARGSIDPHSPTDELAELGWTVQPNGDGRRYMISKPHPPFAESARYFRSIGKVLRLDISAASDISGIAALRDLPIADLNVSGGSVTDLTELGEIKNIAVLSIGQSRVRDISFISRLRNLKDLSLWDDPVADISPLSELSQLTRLVLGSTYVTDLAPIRHLSSLTFLGVAGTPVRDLSALGDVPTLKELSITGSQVPLLSGFQNPSIEKMIVSENSTTAYDLTPIGRMLSLKSLSIAGSRLHLEPLSALRNLTELIVNGSPTFFIAQLDSVSTLGELRNLKSLIFSWTNLNNIKFISSLSDLTSLVIVACPVSDIAPIGSLHALKTVVLQDTFVGDISPFLTLPVLSEVALHRTPARVDVITELERRGVKVNR